MQTSSSSVRENGPASSAGRVLVQGAILSLVALLASGCCVAGVSKYLEKSKEAEGKVTLMTIGMGLKACAQEPGAKGGKKGLPPSSNSVPAALASVSGKKYQSAPADWNNPAWQCAKFQMSTPQYYQYRWELQSPTKGVIHAEADFGGSGKGDSSMTMPIECPATGDCTIGQLSIK